MSSYDLSDSREKIENHILHSVKIDAFKFDILLCTFSLRQLVSSGVQINL